MSSLTHIPGRLFAQRCLIITQKRYNIREQIHRYVEPDKFKKHMLAACVPYYKRKYANPEETCKGVPKNKHELHPLDIIYTKELLEDISRKDYILFIQYNYTPFQSERVYKNTITKLGGTFHALNNNIYVETFKSLKDYTDVTSLFVGRNALITGKVESLSQCVKALGKMPQFIFLGGFVDKHLYTVANLRMISNYKNIEDSRSNLLATLTTPALNLSSNLQQLCETLDPQNEAPTETKSTEENKPK